MHVSKRKLSLGLLLLASGILLISVALVIKYIPRKIIESNPNDNQNLLGQDRLDKQNELVKTIKGYLADIPNLKNYLQKNSDCNKNAAIGIFFLFVLTNFKGDF